MKINESKNMTQNDWRKAGILLNHAGNVLGMDCSGYGEIDVNPRSGNVYLWLEGYNFCLYIGLGSDTVIACYSCPIDGEEAIRKAGKSLERLEAWASKLARKSDKKEGA